MLTSKTAKRLKECINLEKAGYKPKLISKDIISFNNELKEIIGTQCNCLPCHRFRELIQEIESVEK